MKIADRKNMEQTPEIKICGITSLKEISALNKYHPEYALGNGGLLRHTKAAVRIGYELLSNPAIGDKYTSDERDLMLMGLLLLRRDG